MNLKKGQIWKGTNKKITIIAAGSKKVIFVLETLNGWTKRECMTFVRDDFESSLDGWEEEER